MANFPDDRKLLSHNYPEYYDDRQIWMTDLIALQKKGHGKVVGRLIIDRNLNVISNTDVSDISKQLHHVRRQKSIAHALFADAEEPEEELIFGDGIEGAKKLKDKSVDLLLTDPPYSISKAYTCETQVPRRIRKNGRDFIMPKGHFGAWDYGFAPNDWCDIVLPKVGGWCVIFCSHAQIGAYSEILENHSFNAIGTFVWQKTNPVPFNHKFKPINAWEAIVIGKRPGTKFNGKLVHNIFKCKSPSPQSRIHPTQKPIQLIEYLTDLFSRKGDFVFDPFAGSATTVLVAKHLSRKVLSYENDKSHYEAAIQRLKKGVYK